MNRPSSESGDAKPSLKQQMQDNLQLFKMMLARPERPKPASATSAPAEERPRFFERHPRVKKALWQRKIAPAFWTLSSVVSMVVNIILIIVLIVVVQQLFFLKEVVHEKLIGGLYENFVKMDEARIKAMVPVDETIQVNDTMPVVFDLPLAQGTTVTLIKDTPISQATVFLNGAPVATDIVLPAGTPLGITLDLVVPVSQTIPVVLNVPVKLNVNVDIPLSQTDLHEPFVGLQKVVEPYKELLDPLPSSWSETPLCGPALRWLCRWFGVK